MRPPTEVSRGTRPLARGWPSRAIASQVKIACSSRISDQPGTLPLGPYGAVAEHMNHDGHRMMQSPDRAAREMLMPLENPVLAGNHRIRPLPFDSTRLTGLSNQLLLSHHREYAAAVRELNGVERDLARVGERTPPDLVARLRERELALTNSAILHEHYFESLGSNGH